MALSTTTGSGVDSAHPDVLDLDEVVGAVLRALAPDAGLLHPAERHAQVAQHPAVDPDRAAVDPLGNAVRAVAVAALGSLIDPRPVPVSAQLVRGYNYFIRCYALDEIATASSSLVV